jgi:hypothetical protein
MPTNTLVSSRNIVELQTPAFPAGASMVLDTITQQHLSAQVDQAHQPRQLAQVDKSTREVPANAQLVSDW